MGGMTTNQTPKLATEPRPESRTPEWSLDWWLGRTYRHRGFQAVYKVVGGTTVPSPNPHALTPLTPYVHVMVVGGTTGWVAEVNLYTLNANLVSGKVELTETEEGPGVDDPFDVGPDGELTFKARTRVSK